MADKTILVVEDNEIQREGLAFVLRKEGYAVIAAAGGAEAVAALGRIAAPDLILLDMTIPPPDGWRILAMRKKNPALVAVPVAIITALGVAHEDWAKSLGACALIRKPVEVEPLLAEVRRCLSQGQGDRAGAAPPGPNPV